MTRWLCVHGHFYQPPRENPWLESVELQDSAHPFHDWNERVTRECYAPNAVARILDGDGRIERIVNNYAQLSFNFGPTLLAWLETEAPDVYARVLAGDALSAQRFGGHGSAMAQAYNHMILPLASSRDKRTQVIWGIRDFVHRFRRQPEGMWLPETAVDLETLGLLAEHGIRFTVLSPTQARRVRGLGKRAWQDVDGGRVDPRKPYLVRLPGRARIAVFFYDGLIARAVAFEHLLNDGQLFAERLLQGFDDREPPQLVSIATDGETYGHHRRGGEMALAYALGQLSSHDDLKLTNYAEFLALHPPTEEAEIAEHSSWSCAHGVGRWWTDCGCNGGRAGWHQAWRTPLRNALDWLRDALAPMFEEGTRGLLADPWRARDDYASIVLDRSEEQRAEFLRRHAARPLDPDGDADAIVRALKWLELQRQAMLMYTSCGWFFDDISGLETVQVLRYAGRAIQLARELTGADLEPRLLEMLAEAKSNVPESRDGAYIYRQQVKPATVDLFAVGAHFAMTSLFNGNGERASINAYRFDHPEHRLWSAGLSRLAVGRTRVSSVVTGESMTLSYSAVHFGDHELHGAVRESGDAERHTEMATSLQQAFDQGDHAELIRRIDQHFGSHTYSLRELFRDDQRRIVDEILRSTIGSAESSYRQVYERSAPLMHFLRGIGVRQPPALVTAAQFVLNASLRRALRLETLDRGRIAALVEEAQSRGITLEADGLRFELERNIERIATHLRNHPDDVAIIDRLATAVSLARTLPLSIDLWQAQNVYHELRADGERSARAREAGGPDWHERFTALGAELGFRVD